MTIIIFIIYTTKQQSRIQRDSLVQALLYNNTNIVYMFGVVRTNDGIIDETFDYKFTKEIPDPLGGAQSVEFIAGEVQMEIFGDFQI